MLKIRAGKVRGLQAVLLVGLSALTLLRTLGTPDLLHLLHIPLILILGAALAVRTNQS
jgi:hypothetical protein